jgi:IclR helix-turn-helix domain
MRPFALLMRVRPSLVPSRFPSNIPLWLPAYCLSSVGETRPDPTRFVKPQSHGSRPNPCSTGVFEGRERERERVGPRLSSSKADSGTVFPHGATTRQRAGVGDSFDAMGLAFDSTRTAAGGAGEGDPQIFERGLARLSDAVGEAVRGRARWLERVRAGLVAFLGFFDDEPGWGRVLILPAPALAEVAAQRSQQRVLGVLSALLDDGCPSAIGELMPEPTLTSELVAGGVVSVLRTRLREQEAAVPGAADDGALVALAPALMAFIVRPYLGEAAASAELSGASAPAEETFAPDAEPHSDDEPHAGMSALVSEPALPDAIEPRGERLAIRVTRRTLLVLGAIGRAPGSSNRRVAELAGLSDEGQTSRLLARLAERGLVRNVGVGAAGGEPNAWLLTVRGRRMLELSGAAQRADAASWRGRRARGWA